MDRRPSPSPPGLFLRFFRWYCHPKLVKHIEGDLMELYNERVKERGKAKADIKFTIDVVLLCRPGIIRPVEPQANVNTYGMLKSYFKVGWRTLLRNKAYSLINIGGLAAGMAVTILIGLWIWDELSFNKNFENYDRVAQVWQFVTFDVEKSSYNSLPIPLSEELRSSYPDFERVSMSSFNHEVILGIPDKNMKRFGSYVETDFTEMMSLNMQAGSRRGLDDMHSIMLSRTLAKDLFGGEDPMNRMITLNENTSVKVTGVFNDFPHNSSFSDVTFLAPWDLYVSMNNYAGRSVHAWDENSWLIFAHLREGSDFKAVSDKIRDIRMKLDNPPGYKPEFFLHPMSKWHLHSEFKNGVNTGGLVTYVWLFGMIGVFVLVLACINFMNLATARSEKRAKEVGLRKSVGSARSQLIAQFLCESWLTVFFSFVISIVLVQLMLPFFNEIAAKQVEILWTNPWFWLMGLLFLIITGLMAGSYPALYLSSFIPVKVLKGTFAPGRLASLPRKILVVVQFTVSITLMIGIVVVFRQIDFARSRPVGYNHSGLIEIGLNTPHLRHHFDALRNDLLNSGAIAEIGGSNVSITSDYGGTTNISWRGKVHGSQPLLMDNRVTHEFGKTVGWKVINGRDFSRDVVTDTTAMILNESAASLMGFEDPKGEVVTTGGKEYTIIGVVGDIIKESPFTPVKPSFFTLNYNAMTTISMKLASNRPTANALRTVEDVIRKYDPSAPFEYEFVEEGYAAKFADVERIGKLSGFFTILAIAISCLGIFGLASFMAERRTKEIGVRKVLGASVFNLWKMLSRDFVLLVVISTAISIPIAYYVMSNWLQFYEYRTELSWWIFGLCTVGALVITLLTVSYQSVKASMANPVKSLRNE